MTLPNYYDAQTDDRDADWLVTSNLGIIIRLSHVDIVNAHDALEVRLSAIANIQDRSDVLKDTWYVLDNRPHRNSSGHFHTFKLMPSAGYRIAQVIPC